MFTTEKFNRRMLNAGLGISAVAALALAGCGSDGEDDEAEGLSTDGVVESTEEAGPANSVDITVSGALNGHISEFIGEPKCRSFNDEAFNNVSRYIIDFDVEFNDEEYVLYLNLRPDGLDGEYSAADSSLVLRFYNEEPYRYTTFPSDFSPQGTITINEDLSGSLNDVTLGPSNEEDHDVEPVTLNGSWTCAEVLGDPNDDEDETEGE